MVATEFVHAWQFDHLVAAHRRHLCRSTGRLRSRQPPGRRLRLSARHVADGRVRAVALHPGIADRTEGRFRAAVHPVDGFYGLSENPRRHPDRVLSSHGQRAHGGAQYRSRSDQSRARFQGDARTDILEDRVSDLAAADVCRAAHWRDARGRWRRGRRTRRRQYGAGLSLDLRRRPGRYAHGVRLDRDAHRRRRHRLSRRHPRRAARAALPAGDGRSAAISSGCPSENARRASRLRNSD